MLPSANELIAQFLRSHGYTETLKSFIAEAGLPVDVGAASNGSVTIETILHEKTTFDLSLNFEKLGMDDKDRRWTVQAPSEPTVLGSLPSRSNILSIAVFDLLLPSAASPRQYVAVSTADRRLHLMKPTSSTFELVHSYSCFQDSPILDVVAIGSQYLLVASMSGKLHLHDTASDTTLDVRKDHSKYLVKLASWCNGNATMIASAAWDARVLLYQLDIDDDAPQLGEPIAALTLPSIPETLLFIRSPEHGTPVLLLTRRDSTFLYYYAIPSHNSPGFTLLGKQNLAPHSNAWVAFTPSDVRICPTDPTLVAVATSTTPHMKLLVVKLLLPPTQSSALDTDDVQDIETVTQASQARAELLIQNREEAAILVNVSTLAPQTAYSTPTLVWRPDGSGIFVSSDDGTVRGIEANSGKLVTTLSAHEPGSKLRCLWAGHLKGMHDDNPDSDVDNEYLISGGFDQRLILWSS
ncbi:hypothetical protein P153DRAFT_285778 [Dothidotthia symphoricarpi CBS 119687]|uniref:Anaphase-promoting complex subunit 4-like WD40 domain-containing protein n=1 Tax=Dothidotthia symphoricarpi CBS 119687 TaxID=1392245 RepID=A0A6A6AM01_9PLEO|nr:uncharacterized protein P153DRAFT_285778 [Dothidotthia symphoricarpi CBS 119687]KAF2132158.1 hypothetical protein P153DRAFT_285778 [Dothidotthia symphoricarpi CBS 119687]